MAGLSLLRRIRFVDLVKNIILFCLNQLNLGWFKPPRASMICFENGITEVVKVFLTHIEQKVFLAVGIFGYVDDGFDIAYVSYRYNW